MAVSLMERRAIERAVINVVEVFVVLFGRQFLVDVLGDKNMVEFEIALTLMLDEALPFAMINLPVPHMLAGGIFIEQNFYLKLLRRFRKEDRVAHVPLISLRLCQLVDNHKDLRQDFLSPNSERHLALAKYAFRLCDHIPSNQSSNGQVRELYHTEHRMSLCLVEAHRDPACHRMR